MNTENRYCRRAARRQGGPALVLAAGLAANLVAGCSEESGRPLAPGEAEYRRFCATCHQADGAGRRPAFPPLAGSEWLAPGPDAVALVALLGLKGEIEVAGQTWRGYMPPMRQVDDGELAALIGYIGRTWANWPEVPDAGPTVERIAELRRTTEGMAQLGGRDDLERVLDEIER